MSSGSPIDTAVVDSLKVLDASRPIAPPSTKSSRSKIVTRDCIVGLLECLKQLGLIGSSDAGAGVTHQYMECAIVRFGLNGAA
jgi:hypothetical protein